MGSPQVTAHGGLLHLSSPYGGALMQVGPGGHQRPDSQTKGAYDFLPSGALLQPLATWNYYAPGTASRTRTVGQLGCQTDDVGEAVPGPVESALFSGSLAAAEYVGGNAMQPATP